MDKDFFLSFVLSLIALFGLGIGFLTLVLFFNRNLTQTSALIVAILMVISGLFGLAGLLSRELSEK